MELHAAVKAIMTASNTLTVWIGFQQIILIHMWDFRGHSVVPLKQTIAKIPDRVATHNSGAVHAWGTPVSFS